MRRRTGAFSLLPVALTDRVVVELLSGRFGVATSLAAEADAVVEATGSHLAQRTPITLANWRGRDAGAIAQLSWIKGHPIAAFFVRKKPKEHGARLAVEGLAKGESLQDKRVVILEDVTTTGGSALKAVEAVREAGGEVALVFTMVDRDEGAADTFAQAGIPFRSLYNASEFLRD